MTLDTTNFNIFLSRYDLRQRIPLSIVVTLCYFNAYIKYKKEFIVTRVTLKFILVTEKKKKNFRNVTNKVYEVTKNKKNNGLSV